MKDEYTSEDARADRQPRLRSCRDGMCGAEDCERCGNGEPEEDKEIDDLIETEEYLNQEGEDEKNE